MSAELNVILSFKDEVDVKACTHDMEKLLIGVAQITLLQTVRCATIKFESVETKVEGIKILSSLDYINSVEEDQEVRICG